MQRLILSRSSKNITISFEHIGFEWLGYADALARITYANSKNVFKKIERNDFVYFFRNYLIDIALISLLVKYIKPILPRLIWTKLKYFKRYLAA